MKIIHTADLHLDSPLVGVADSAKRRGELLRALSDMSEFANNAAVAAVIVAGDLFDDKFVTSATVKSVAEIISRSNAQWYILRGNHGDYAPYEKLQKLCSNVHGFGYDWQKYDIGAVTIVGRECGENDVDAWKRFSVDTSRYNILVLHGDVDSDAYGVIDKKAIADSGVDYVALGHRHAFAPLKFGRVKGCYSGVLEARGFDESAETGFVLIDTDKDEIAFRKQHVRKVETITVDVSDVENDIVLEKLIEKRAAEADARNYLNVQFVGTLSDDVRLLPVAEEVLQNRFFALRLDDETKPKVDYDALKKEVSLRGEFVKLVNQMEDETLRDEILSLGLHALSGGDLK